MPSDELSEKDRAASDVICDLLKVSRTLVLHYLYTADKRDGMACKFEASDGVTAEANLLYEQVIHSESFSIYLIHLPQLESNILG